MNSKEEAIASIVADDLRPARGYLKSHIHKRIRRGVLAGLVTLGEDGLATAEVLTSVVADRVTKSALRGEVDDLAWLLKQPDGQRNALTLLHAIDAGATIPIDVGLSTEHARELALALSFCPLPPKVAERVAPTLDRLMRESRGYSGIRDDVPSWFLALVAVVGHYSRLGVNLELDDLLAKVAGIVGPERMLPAMLAPLPKQRNEAAKNLKETRIAKARPGGSRGAQMAQPPVSAWTAARAIAAAFGFRGIPAKAADAKSRAKGKGANT